MENSSIEIEFNKVQGDPNRYPGLYYRVEFDNIISDDDGNKITKSLHEILSSEGVLVFVQWGQTFMEGFFDNTHNIEEWRIKKNLESFVKITKHKILKCTFTKVEK